MFLGHCIFTWTIFSTTYYYFFFLYQKKKSATPGEKEMCLAISANNSFFFHTVILLHSIYSSKSSLNATTKKTKGRIVCNWLSQGKRLTKISQTLSFEKKYTKYKRNGQISWHKNLIKITSPITNGQGFNKYIIHPIFDFLHFSFP